MHFVYILRCCDGSYYVGITDDPQARIALHNAGHVRYQQWVLGKKSASQARVVDVEGPAAVAGEDLEVLRSRPGYGGKGMAFASAHLRESSGAEWRLDS